MATYKIYGATEDFLTHDMHIKLRRTPSVGPGGRSPESKAESMVQGAGEVSGLNLALMRKPKARLLNRRQCIMLPLTSCVTLSKSLNLSEFPFPPL